VVRHALVQYNQMPMKSAHPNFLPPAGTQIVVRVPITDNGGTVIVPSGAVGVIVKAPVDPTHAYRVRFMDGTEATLKRQDFIIHSHFKNPQQPDDPLAGIDLYERVIYRCVVGSRAYGLDVTGSDTDLRGIYLPPADLHWSLYGVPEQLENPETEECYWEVQKFLILALKANPNILECLYTPLVERATPLAQELLDMREIFLSKLIYQTYNGYVMSQFKKLQKHIQNKGTIKWKHAMHLIRLLLSGITALEQGYVLVDVGEYRTELLAIRSGGVPWEDVNARRLELHKAFDAAFQKTALPDRPDYERANAYLVKARRSAFESNQ
jgi:hypothetical protein